MKNARIRLGQEILRRRKAMGMTQEELASRMGVSRQSVAKWETGLSSPDIDRLVLLRDVLQTSLDELIAPAGRELIPVPVPPAEDSVRPAPAGPVRNLRLLPLILARCCSAAAWAGWRPCGYSPACILSVSWTGMAPCIQAWKAILWRPASGLSCCWPASCLAAAALRCFICGARAEKTADPGSAVPAGLCLSVILCDDGNTL